MKTKEQIIEYLRNKHLYGRVLNYNDNSHIRGTLPHVLRYDRYLIFKAFVWTRTPEGDAFWSEEDRLFSDWYSRADV